MQTQSQQEQGWNAIFDFLLPVLTVAVLLLSCILGSVQKEIWIDEAFTLQVITDRSLPHIMHGLANAVDGGMPLYYLLAYGWASVFGTSLLSLRLFSSVFVCAGILLLWITLRRSFSAAAVALAILATTVTSATLLHQNVEARYYGFYFACTVLVFALHDRLAVGLSSRRLLIGAVLAHAALVMSHPFGVLYSGAAIAALQFTDYRSGKLRWGMYAALAASWLLLLAWIGPLLRIHDLGQPRNWTPIPTMTEVLALYAFASPCLAFGLLMGTGLTVFAPTNDEPPASGKAAPLLYHAFAFLLPPIPIALISWGKSSMFVGRYFLPSLIGVATLTAYLLDLRLRAVRRNRMLLSAWCALLAVILAWPVVSMEKVADNRFAVMDKTIQYDLPVFVPDANQFLPLTFVTRKASRPYYYPLDWDSALHSEHAGATLEYKLMRNARASGYTSDRIVDTPDALCLSENFLVLNNQDYPWFRERVFRNSDFQVEHLGDFAPDRQLWLVKRLPNSTVCTGK